jgi:hypothetical protein
MVVGKELANKCSVTFQKSKGLYYTAAEAGILHNFPVTEKNM